MNGWFFERYQTNVLHVDRESHLLSIAWKWLGEKKTYVRTQPDSKTYRKGTEDDLELAQVLYDLYQQADIIITHNGDSFDHKVAYARFILHGFQPPPPHKSIDTLKIARRHFRFSSNRLDDLGEYLGVGRKVHTGGKKLWIDCLKGDKKAWKLMAKYNKQDVVLLEEVYKKLQPWHSTHPSMTDDKRMDDFAPCCLVCGSDSVQRRGTREYNVSSFYYRYQCTDCGLWGRGGNHRKI